MKKRIILLSLTTVIMLLNFSQVYLQSNSEATNLKDLISFSSANAEQWLEVSYYGNEGIVDYWIGGASIVANNKYEKAKWTLTETTGISYNATSNTFMVSPSIAVGYSSGTLVQTNYECEWCLANTKCDRANEKTIYRLNS